MSEHFDESVLEDYLNDPDALPEKSEIEFHLAECRACRDLLDELRAFDASLSGAGLWSSAGAASQSAPEAIRALAGLLEAEDTEARRLLAPYLVSPVAFQRANVAALPAMRNAGVVRRLCGESRELRERQPMHALVLADAAIAIADQLPADPYPRAMLEELRGDAWLERANVLRYLGRYPEALDAVDIAARAFSGAPVPAFPSALVDYLRGVIFVEIERLEEALRLVRRSARVFRQFGEDERYIHARMVEATILYDQKQERQACVLFLSLVDAAKEIGSAETLARLYANIANCRLQLGQLDSADEYYSRALSLYEALGLETGRIRTRWNIGCLRIAMGDVADGISRLRTARRELEEIGLRSDAALVTLDLAAALLSTERDSGAREAAELCNGLAESLSSVGMAGHALTALAFLRQAFEAGRATPHLVRHVRRYLETRPDQTGNPFVPPHA